MLTHCWDADHLMDFLGWGTFMAKLDIWEALLHCHYPPEQSAISDQCFLRVTWWDHIYVDYQLPFGLASTLEIFSAFGEALEWILQQKQGSGIIHYIDDFCATLGTFDIRNDGCQSTLPCIITIATSPQMATMRLFLKMALARSIKAFTHNIMQITIENHIIYNLTVNHKEINILLFFWGLLLFCLLFQNFVLYNILQEYVRAHRRRELSNPRTGSQ